MAQTVENLLAMQEAWVRSLGQKDPPEKEMATHFSILAWRIPWTEEHGGLQSMGVAKSQPRLSNSTARTAATRGSLNWIRLPKAFGSLVQATDDF